MQRGYAVAVPRGPGHGETGGPYLESNRGCANADYRASGNATADSIQAAIDYLVAQPFVKKTDVIVVGQSAGGWGALALASRNPRNVKAVINFAGGRGGHMQRSAEQQLRAGEIDRGRAQLRRLRANSRFVDLYRERHVLCAVDFETAQRSVSRAAGGRVEYRLMPAFGFDGHTLFGAQDGVRDLGSGRR